MNSRFLIIKKSVLSALFFVGVLSTAFAQADFSFVKVEDTQVLGRLAVMAASNNFGRLPLSVQGLVRSPVWSLGQNSAGLYVDFKTDSKNIVVKYKVKGALNMPHMPTIGVSGVDLYFHNETKKNWEWAFGRYAFKDTITYTFSNIGQNVNGSYRLYLPLYNSVEFLEIGVDKASQLSFVEDRTKPIVVYGTSIAQGACASRPGLAWTNILSRDFSNEVINLGFSGNGRLEKPILDLIVAEDAAVYLLDCIPNLSLTKDRSAAQLDSLILSSVHYVRSKRPNAAIVLTEHSSAYTTGFLNIATMDEYAASTKVVKNSFDQLKKSGMKNLYFLSSKEIGLDINSTVDYAHPNDLGMMKIAKAYERILKRILR